MRRQVLLDQLVPIPVGHHVRIRELEVRHGRSWVPASYDALVNDLDTGVEYVPARLFSSAGPSSSSFSASLLAEKLDAAHARVVATWTGRVVACRVATNASQDHGYATRLLIQPDR